MASESLLNRIRRNLAYRLLPDTSEFEVATTRQDVLLELRGIVHTADVPPHRVRSAVRAHHRLRENVPVREEWDNSQHVGKGDPDGK